MEATCREVRAERSDRPFERSTDRARNRAVDRPPDRQHDRASDRRLTRGGDRSSERVPSNRTAETKTHRGKDRSRDRLESNDRIGGDCAYEARASAHRTIGIKEGFDRVPTLYNEGNEHAETRTSGHRTIGLKERLNDRVPQLYNDGNEQHAEPRTSGHRTIGLKEQLNDRVPQLYSDGLDATGHRTVGVKDQLVPDLYSNGASDESEEDDCEQAGEEVCVWVDDRQLWVSGVLAGTTCSELVRALLPHQPGHARSSEADWVITERWRSMEQPLEGNATILDIWNAWGDAQSEIRFTLRYVDSSGDSGRGSPPSPRGRERRRPAAHRRRPRPQQLFPQLLRAQGDTLTLQADRLREQDRQISHLEEQTHKTRMAKHGPNYLLESYLRDIARNNNELGNCDDRRDELAGISELNNIAQYDHKNRETIEINDSGTVQTGEGLDNHARSSEATDSPAANSDSGVGVSGSPPRANKRRSRGRHLLREHYLTKELTDICQINANRIVQTKSDDNSETSTDELSRIQQQIDILEKLTIVNKRLQREEELIVRLGVKLRRYLCEDEISYIDSQDQIVSMLNTLRSQMDNSSKEIENAAIEMERADYQLEKRKNLLDILAKELEDVDLESQTLEVQNTIGDSDHMFTDVQYVTMQTPYEDNALCNLPLDISKTQFVNVNYNINNVPNYPLDTLV